MNQTLLSIFNKEMKVHRIYFQLPKYLWSLFGWTSELVFPSQDTHSICHLSIGIRGWVLVVGYGTCICTSKTNLLQESYRVVNRSGMSIYHCRSILQPFSSTRGTKLALWMIIVLSYVVRRCYATSMVITWFRITFTSFLAPWVYHCRYNTGCLIVFVILVRT